MSWGNLNYLSNSISAMRILKLRFAAVILMCCQSLSAQNLIPNFSFEQNDGCPSGIYLKRSKWLVKDWENATSGTPDYFHRCATHEVSIPYNWAGKSQPVHGDAYVGIYIWDDYKEYLKVQLKDPLKAGKRYYFEGYYQISTHSHYVTGDISAVFYRKNENFFQVPPQIIVAKDHPFDGNPLEWEKLSGSFIARGGEEYMTVGHLNDQKETNALAIDVNADKEFQLKNRSYAYLDHFRLWEEGTYIPEDSAFLTPLPDKIILSDINFQLDSYELLENAKNTLDPLITYLSKQGDEDYVLLITGYTDDIGSTSYNKKLSLNRAKSVALYLFQSQIPKNLMKTFGNGELSPLYPNNSKENRIKNRRVEIEIRTLNQY